MGGTMSVVRCDSYRDFDIMSTPVYGALGWPEPEYATAERWKYPGGEVGIRIVPPYGTKFGLLKRILVVARLNSHDDLFELLQVVETIRNLDPRIDIFAFIPYIPYGRNDRRTANNEGLGLKVMAKILNDCNFAQIFTIDPHSSVTEVLLDRVTAFYPTLTSSSFYNKFFTQSSPFMRTIFILPDAGAEKKYRDKLPRFANGSAPRIAVGEKVRNPKTGVLSDFVIRSMPETTVGYAKEKYLVVDDICDGGGTLLGLADALARFCGVVNPMALDLGLYVTHGIFSNNALRKLSGKYSFVAWTETRGEIDPESLQMEVGLL